MGGLTARNPWYPETTERMVARGNTPKASLPKLYGRECSPFRAIARKTAVPRGAPCPPGGHCAGAGQSAQEAQSHWVSWRATSSRRSQPHRCWPRPQRPAAICDSRTGRRTRPAPDWQLPRRWAHILETPEQTAPPVVVNLISPPPPRWGEAGRRVWALARALMARR